MFTTSGSTSIARPAADVFAFIADVRNDPRWHTDVLAAKLLEGTAVERHSIFEIETKPVMGVSGGTVEISQYEPPRRIVFEVRMGKLQPTTTFTIVPDGAGCQVTRRIDMEPQGLMRAMAPLMGGMMRKRNDTFLANLRRVLGEKAVVQEARK
jgi:carbon monoxide dehydrogenase subunit G